jgi:hypothetical protein
MLMLLHRSPEQESALEGLLAAQQNPSSPLFHRWLTPEQFGALYGPADQDVRTITDWLSSHGFTGMTVSKGRTVIEFSGTADKVQNAFHTAIHRYQVGGSLHLANQNDPSIPAALAPVVGGVVSLNDFGHRSLAIQGPTLGSTNGQPHPQIAPGAIPLFTISDPQDNTTFYGVVPYDFAAIYDLLPLWKAGLDGAGQSIAIVSESNINLNDPEQFRAFFGLPANDPTVILDGVDPGIQSDEIEADLDVQWSGAVAPGAHVLLVTSASTETTAGTDLSALYIVDNNLAPVMSESYGECELFLGTAGNAFEAALWEQASAEGITALVASGDQGSAVCDLTGDMSNLAVHPMAVNGLASSPYNIAVGGTDFNQHNLWTQYWNQNNDPTTKQSVLGYIPEIPWNDSCGSTTLDVIYGDTPASACNDGATGVLFLNTIAGSGGPSSCIGSDGTNASSCTVGWPKPAWQTGTGVPADGVRDLPDVSFFASNGVNNSAYVVCEVDASGGSGCNPTASSQTLLAVGGTSASAPAMAGVMAIVNQKYGRQGNANPTLYRLAAGASGASIFPDITTDGNRVACTSRSPDCLIPAGAAEPIGTMKGHDSTVGYDMVTGLGSIDIANLVNNWSAVGFTPTTTTLDLNGGTGVVVAVHGSPINAVVGVSASSGSPGGGVSLIDSATNGSLYLGALAGGTTTGTVNTLPGGSYAVTAHYAGDTQFAPSNSAPVSVNISPEPSATKVSILNYNAANGTFAPANSVPYGSLLLIRTDLTGQSGFGVATGSVTLTDSGNSLGEFALNAQGSAEDMPTSLLLAGVHSLKASYTGDPSFSSSGATGGVTVTPAQMTCGLEAYPTVLRPGWSLTLYAETALYQPTLAPPLGMMVAPTGTITIFSGSTAVSGPTVVTGIGGAILSGGPGVTFSSPAASIPTVTLQISQLSSVAAPVTMVYSGDANYAGCTSPSVQLTYQTAPLTSQIGYTLSATQNILVGTPISLSTGVSVGGIPVTNEPYPTPTGTVQLIIDGVNVGSPDQLTPAFGSPPGGGSAGPYGAASLTIATATLSPGMHTSALSYSGDSNYLPSTSQEINFWLVIPDFSISANLAMLKVTNGQTTGAGEIEIGYQNGFTGTVTLSCSGLPSEASCVFSPTTVTGSGNSSLTIVTTKAEVVRGRAIARNFSGSAEWLAGVGGIPIVSLIVLSAPRRRRKGIWLCIVAVGAFELSSISCGGGGSDSQNTITQPSQVATTTSLSATSFAPAKGASDTFTATVNSSGQALATGSIQFSVDGAASGSAVALTNATAQFATSFSTAGAHSVGASYSGDTTHAGSTASAFPISVPFTTGTLPGTYYLTVTGTSGALSHFTYLTLLVQ